MLIARVIGSAVSSVKDEKLTGLKLLVVREVSPEGEATGKPLVAIDAVGAGINEVVLIATGSSARQTTVTTNRPVDAVIMAILDSLEVDGQVVYRKE
jgi:microcompartment protein CcmK/EutM